MKRCPSCGEHKAETEFPKNRQNRDGLNTYCKVCASAKTKANKAKPPRYTPPPGLKRCGGCKQDLPIDQFWAETGTYDGLHKWCKPCSSARHTKYRKANQAYLNADRSRRARENPERFMDYERKKRYGLPYGEYREMLEAQGGGCAICGTTNPGGGRKSFAVDHCHDSDVVRGLLCGACNNGLGRFKHNPHFLRSAARYIELFQPPSSSESPGI